MYRIAVSNPYLCYYLAVPGRVTNVTSLLVILGRSLLVSVIHLYIGAVGRLLGRFWQNYIVVYTVANLLKLFDLVKQNFDRGERFGTPSLPEMEVKEREGFRRRTPPPPQHCRRR